MMFNFRPEDDPRNTLNDDWADNALSNSLAFLSAKLIPNWCQAEGHWTASLTAYLFASCACCLLFRGLTLGLLPSLILFPVLIIALLR
jgi:Protein of unknown function (DUF418)